MKQGFWLEGVCECSGPGTCMDEQILNILQLFLLRVALVGERTFAVFHLPSDHLWGRSRSWEVPSARRSDTRSRSPSILFPGRFRSGLKCIKGVARFIHRMESSDLNG